MVKILKSKYPGSSLSNPEVVRQQFSRKCSHCILTSVLKSQPSYDLRTEATTELPQGTQRFTKLFNPVLQRILMLYKQL
jgi:hypothetical protein